MKKGIIYYKPGDVSVINEEHLSNCFDHTAVQRSAVWWNEKNPITVVDLSGKSKKDILEFANLHTEDTLIITYQDRFPIADALMPYKRAEENKYFYYFHAGDLDIGHCTSNEEKKFYETMIEPLSPAGSLAMIRELAENEKNGEFLIIHNIPKFKLLRFGKGWVESEGAYFSNSFFREKKWVYTTPATQPYMVGRNQQNNQSAYANSYVNKESGSVESFDLLGIHIKPVGPQLANYFQLPPHIRYFVSGSNNPRIKKMDFLSAVAGNTDFAMKSLEMLVERRKVTPRPLHASFIRYDQLAWSDPSDRNKKKHVQEIKTVIRDKYITTLTNQQKFFLATKLAESFSESKEDIDRNRILVSKLDDITLIQKSAFLDLNWESISS